MEKLFGSRIRAKLLGWFFTHVDESYFVRQLAAILDEDPTNLSREMSRLENLGILKSERHGKLKQFQVNRRCGFFNELKGLVLKTAGVAGQIREAIQDLKGIKFAFIYGSYARGKEEIHSDVDVMIIGDIDMDKFDDLVMALDNKLGRTINYLVYSPEEFSAKRREKDSFIKNVLAGPRIMLIGRDNDLKAA
ncbi:MAG: nucleotidyltransferase domain-containing protein [Syntrophales bacterium]|nr:nucleotidyltransferase domain-containing protein [Syntrophales bacterium]MDD5531621.1 nucleotidyltransferase domain-containing protein [Syntrophales bacterium]